MAGPSPDLTTEWEGGSLTELVSALQSAAMPVRIEVIQPGTAGSVAGEVHLLAGGLADAFAGSLRRDDAMAALQRLEGARYVIETRLPDPETGSLATPGPQEGSLKERPVAALMRYCEDYVLTCRIEVWRGQERAVIGYRRGEIISTSVAGSEASERLPEVMGWSEGSYQIVLPAPVLPVASPRKPPARAVEPLAKNERKRHSTLPLAPGAQDPATGEAAEAAAGAPAPRGEAQAAARSVAPAVPPAPARTSSPRAPATTQPLASRPATGPQPTQPVAPALAARSSASPAPEGPKPSVSTAQPRQATPAATSAMAGTAAARTATPALGMVAGRPPTEPLPAESTTRGTPPVPAVPLVAGPRPASALQVKAGDVRGAVPGQATPPARAGSTPPEPVKPERARILTPPPLPTVVPTPPPFRLAQPPASLSTKKAPISNDLKPASGIIEAKSKHANHLPSPAPPVEIAEQAPAPAQPSTSPAVVPAPAIPAPAPEPAPPAAVPEPAVAARAPAPQAVAPATAPAPQGPAVVSTPPSGPRRARPRAKPPASEQSFKVYLLVGLAVGAGIVAAHWAYWHLPFFHH